MLLLKVDNRCFLKYHDYTQCVQIFWVMKMDLREELIKLRESTNMNRKQFSEYFDIPYRTMQDWELGNRSMPEYLYRLMAYKVMVEKLDKKGEDTDE